MELETNELETAVVKGLQLPSLPTSYRDRIQKGITVIGTINEAISYLNDCVAALYGNSIYHGNPDSVIKRCEEIKDRLRNRKNEVYDMCDEYCVKLTDLSTR